MPRVVRREDGTVIADDLTVAEIERLRELGVDFDVGDGDGGGGAGGGPTDPDAVPERIEESTGSSDDPDPDDEPADDDGDGDADPAGDADDEPGDDEPADGGDGDADDFDDWDDLDTPGDDAEPSRQDERRYEKVQREEGHKTTDIGTRQTERDANIGRDLEREDVRSDRVQELLDSTGLADDIRRAFERFKTRDITIPAKRGNALNIDGIVRHMSGDYRETRVYQQRYTAATGGRTIGVCLDISGSMEHYGHLGRGAIVDAKVGLGALHIATEAMNDNLVANAFATKYSGDNSDVMLPLIVGPGEAWDWEYLDSVTTEMLTPTAHAVRDMTDLLLDAGGRELVMVVVTDGEPTYTLDKRASPSSGSASVDETLGDAARMVAEARSRGIKVIGMGVGSGASDTMMKHVFGPDGYVLTGTDTLVTDLVNVYENQLDITAGPAGV